MKNILSFLAVIFALCITLLHCGPERLENGSDAPEFTLKNLDGKDIALSDFRGKIVLVHFWADCCPGFSEAFPLLQSAYEHLQTKNFEVLAINTGEPRRIAEYFDDKYDITFPMLVDEFADVALIYNLKTIPANFVVSEQGEIIDIMLGWPSEEYLEKFLSQQQ